MALNFPASPTPGQVFTAEGMTFVWNGTVWRTVTPAIPFATTAEALAGARDDLVISPLTLRAAITSVGQAIGNAGAGGDLPSTFAPLYNTAAFVSTTGLAFIAGTAELDAVFTATGAQGVNYRWTLENVTKAVDVTSWIRGHGINLPASGTLSNAFTIALSTLVGGLIVGDTYRVRVDGQKVRNVTTHNVARVQSVTSIFNV